MVTLADQLAFEKKHRELGQSKMMAQIERAQQDGRITDTPLGTGVLRRYLLWLSERISTDITTDLGKAGRAKAYSPLLHTLDPDAVALITINTLLGSFQSRDGEIQLSTLAYSIGRNVYGELALAHFRDMNSDLYETLTSDLQQKMSRDLRHKLTIFRMQAKENGIELPEWTPSQKLQVGVYLLSLIDGSSGHEVFLCNMNLRQSGNKTKYMISLSENIQHIMGDLEYSLINKSGFAAPCIYPPQDWTGEDGVGGFHGDLKIRAVRFFKGSSYQWEVMNTLGCDNTKTMAMLNAHQRTAWKVNPFILNLVTEMRKRGRETKTVATLAAHKKPERPDFLDLKDTKDFTHNEFKEFAKWKAETRDWHTKTKKVTRVELRMHLAVEAAKEMLQYNEFFFVYQVDSRVRAYPVSGPLNPQGSDVQKALLHAAHGEPIDTPEALYWFKLTIASKFGIDKLAPLECIKWVDDNHDNIIKATLDPCDRDAFLWWSEADKPMQFIALCDEYSRYIKDPAGFLSRIASAMDGTCNGLQNYSAMLRDEVGGRATNLISDASGVPNDIYGDVAKASYNRLCSMVVSDERHAWQEHGFNRSLTKKSVMTQVYGSTFGTCRKSVIEYCTEKELFLKELRFGYSDYAARLIWDGIGDVVVKAKEAMDWLRKSAGLIMKEGADYISWTTPTGYRVVQIYDKCEMIRVQAHIGQKIALKVHNHDKPIGPDKMRHRNAFPPNFIHSVDGSHMGLTTIDIEEKCGKGTFMHFIHDDFGVLPKHAAQLAKSIRQCFVDMHSNYDLENIREEYPFLTDPPDKGNLDINCVLTSINFFR